MQVATAWQLSLMAVPAISACSTQQRAKKLRLGFWGILRGLRPLSPHAPDWILLVLLSVVLVNLTEGSWRMLSGLGVAVVVA